jgi:hypothetical protein
LQAKGDPGDFHCAESTGNAFTALGALMKSKGGGGNDGGASD